MCILWVQKKSREMLVVSRRKEKLRFGDAFLLQIWDSGAHGHLGPVFSSWVLWHVSYIIFCMYL